MPPMWCGACGKNVRIESEDGKTCCSLCGRVLVEDNFTEEATFVKTADGQARMAGNIVRSFRSDFSESRKRTLDQAFYGIDEMVYALGIDGGEEISNGATRLYQIALDRRFTRGRRKEQVQASCLYIMCRSKNKPYLLIDFSEHLRINVYVLGAVFLQLCKLLRLEENPVIQKVVDPSLFIHRFSDRLLGGGKHYVAKTALLIVASMKRDWMQTGRKPSGLCGAALYISTLAHGLKCSKSEIIKTVHICEATLTKRLIEFENTESGGLTIEEFESQAEKFGKDASQMMSLDTAQKASGSGELLCEHKGTGVPQFAYGLCSDCCRDFMILSGGLNGGSEPPAFQHAERKRIMAKEAAADSYENLDSSVLPGPIGSNMNLSNSDELKSIRSTVENDVIRPAHPVSPGGAILQSKTTHDTTIDRTESDFTLDESETLSDIDDVEVNVYINTEEEKNLKTIVWEEINREYLEEQTAKEAAALAAKQAYEAIFANCSEDVEGARQLAAAAAAKVAQDRKVKRQKRAAEFKNLGPPQTPAEATKQMLDRKGLSTRIRYDKLDELFNSEIQSPKKSKPEAEPEHDQDEDFDEGPRFDGNEGYAEEYNFDNDHNEMGDY